MSREDVTVLEISGDIVVFNEPLKFGLKDTISDAIAEAVDDSVEA